MRRTTLILALAILLATAPAARAGEQIDRAVEGRRSGPVYVAPGAQPTLRPAEADRLRRQITDSGAGPLYIAILPDTALGEAGGDANELLAMIANALRRDGTYAAVTGGRFRAGSTVL